MDVRQLAWKCLTVAGSIVWAVIVLSMFVQIGVAVYHGWNPSGFPDFTP